MYWIDLFIVNFCIRIANINLDDGFYAYHSNSEFRDSSIQIHEVYAISESIPWQVLKFGFWNRNSGLVAANVAKWIRRKDLQVSKDFRLNIEFDQ